MRIVFKLFIYNILIKNNKLYKLFKEQFEPLVVNLIMFIILVFGILM